MSITRETPNTIHLGGPIVEVNDIHASEAITPGHLIERNAGLYRKHATATVKASPVFALNQSMMNLGVDTAYASGDLVDAAVGRPGSTFWAWLASGENLADGALLTSVGNGLLTNVGATTATSLAKTIEAKNTTTGAARVRVEVL